jgi:predicted protein tyrosine phosphatase
MTVIMAMIGVLIIGFTIFGANNTTNKNKNEQKKLKVKKPDEKKTKPKSKSLTNEKSLSQTKSSTKDKTDMTTTALMKTKNINKEPNIDFTKHFTVSFEDIEDDDNNEYIAPQPVPFVATEPFLVSKN